MDVKFQDFMPIFMFLIGFCFLVDVFLLIVFGIIKHMRKKDFPYMQNRVCIMMSLSFL